MTVYIPLGFLVLAAMTYPVAMRILAHRMQPMRLEMASLGRRLLADDRLAPIHKDLVKGMLSDVYDPRRAFVMVFGFPVYIAFRAAGFVTDLDLPSVASDVDANIEIMSELHTKSMMASNPFFSVLLIVETAVLQLLKIAASSLFGVGKGRAAADLNNYGNYTVTKHSSVKLHSHA